MRQSTASGARSPSARRSSRRWSTNRRAPICALQSARRSATAVKAEGSLAAWEGLASEEEASVWRLPKYPNRGQLRAGWNGSAGVERSVLGWTGRGWLRLSGLGARRTPASVSGTTLLTVEPISGSRTDRRRARFATRQEAKSSCPAPRNTGSGIFVHTSRRRTHQNLHAGYLHRNLGKIGRAVRRSHPTEFRCARRGTTLSTGLRAPQSCAASV